MPYVTSLPSHARGPMSPSSPPDPTTPFFVGIVSFRDGARCGRTLHGLFANASNPNRVYVAILQQHAPEDVSCVDAYRANYSPSCAFCDQVRACGGMVSEV